MAAPNNSREFTYVQGPRGRPRNVVFGIPRAGSDKDIIEIRGRIGRLHINELGNRGLIDISQMANFVLEQGVIRPGVVYTSFLGSLAKRMGRRRELKNVFRLVATRMRRSVIAAYRDSVGPAAVGRYSRAYAPRGFRREANEGSGRRGRITEGKLERVIASPRNYQPRIDGISFIDRRFMDRQAGHWQRLQAGAPGSAGSPFGRSVRKQSYPFTFAGRRVTRLTLDIPPGPRVSMPKGTWKEGRKFFPRGGRGNFKATKGIRARRFFDVGLATMASPTRGIPAVLDDVFDDWFQQAQREGKQISGLFPLR